VKPAIDNDYEVLRERCGLLDRSGRGKLALTGAETKSFLQGQVSNDVEALEPGTGCYAAFLTPKGKMLGDLRILDTGEEILLDTERVALQDLFNLVRRFSIGYDVALHKRTLETSLLSVIGPHASAATGADAAGLGPREHDNVMTGLGRLVRTDVGVDVLVEAARTDQARAELMRGGAAEVGEEAVECLRIERGRPRYGVDLDDGVIPQEAGLNERAVSFSKGCYVGQETVARLFYRGKPNRHLRGLRAAEALTPGAELIAGDRAVGHVTSAAVSPRLGPIGLGFVRREVDPGERVLAGPAGPAEVVALPFA
jgi:folate-binding protein YgfZ